MASIKRNEGVAQQEVEEGGEERREKESLMIGVLDEFSKV